MRVLLLAPSWFDFYVVELAKALVKNHAVVVVVDQHYAEWAERHHVEETFETACVGWYPSRRQPHRNIAPLVQLARLARRFKPDVIHVQQGEKRFLFGWPLLEHYRTVFDFHNVVPLPGMEHKVLDRFHRWLVKRASGFVVHGEVLRSRLIEQYRTNARNIAVLPFGRFSVFGGAGPRSLREQQRTPNVLFFGRIEPYKGLEYLVKAEPLIAQRLGRDFLITIVGEGNLAAVVPSPVGNPRFQIVNDRVSIVAPYFESADVVVLPYAEASASAVTPVAYAYCKPVVVTDAGSLSETVEHGRTGFVVPRRDPAALAAAIARLLAEP
jgi:starch synthase